MVPASLHSSASAGATRFVLELYLDLENVEDGWVDGELCRHFVDYAM